MPKKPKAKKCLDLVEFGSKDWWETTPIYPPKGLIDSCLRLFELGKIDRYDTVRLIEYAMWQLGERPAVAWEKLKGMMLLMPYFPVKLRVPTQSMGTRVSSVAVCQ